VIDGLPAPPCLGCDACQAGGVLCGLARGKWWCARCFRLGAGKHWPRPNRGLDTAPSRGFPVTPLTTTLPLELPAPTREPHTPPTSPATARPGPATAFSGGPPILLSPRLTVAPTDDLLLEAVRLGSARFRDSRKRKDRAGATKALRDDLMGAVAEAYAAKVTGLKWNATMREFRGQRADVGRDVEVRWTRHPGGGLLFRPGETRARRYLLVVGGYPSEWEDLVDLPLKKAHMPSAFELRFPGWIHGTKIVGDEWAERPDPKRPACWRVPQSALGPISELSPRRGR